MRIIVANFYRQCDAWEFNETSKCKIKKNKKEASKKIKFRFKTCSWLKMQKTKSATIMAIFQEGGAKDNRNYYYGAFLFSLKIAIELQALHRYYAKTFQA